MTVTVEITDSVALVRMDDGKANAISHALLDALEGALDEAEAGAAATVLAGRPGMFSGGFDLSVVGTGDRDAIRALFERGGRLLTRLLLYPKPLVAAATGHGVAMGAFLLLASDLRFGARGAFKFGFNESATGIEIPMFGVLLAQERLQPAFVSRSLILGELFDADTAIAAGLLDYVLEPDAVVEQAQSAAAQLAKLVPDAVAANKRSVRQSLMSRIAAIS